MFTETKNKVLASLAALLHSRGAKILEANSKDLENNQHIDSAMLERLKITPAKIDEMIAAIHKTIAIEDPENKVIYRYTQPSGMKIENKSVPFGKILIIYESRPDVTIEAAITAFKAGNKIVLKGGKEARLSNMELVKCWQDALESAGINKDFAVYFDGDRQDTCRMIKENNLGIDLIIARGGEGLINFILENSKIPVLVSGRGNNFMYIDENVDFEMAISLVLNGKSKVSACNSLDKVLIHKNASKENLLNLITSLREAKIDLIGDSSIVNMDNTIKSIVSEDIWFEEFLAPRMVLSIVEDMDSAIEIINNYSGGHSAGIVTNDKNKAERFQQEVDCAAVFHNASLRFTDGGQFGFGAEIAISTQKLHSRGPIGVAQLCTNKWFIEGNGDIRK